MRNLIIIIAFGLYTTGVSASPMNIVCGTQPGEIYSEGFTSTDFGLVGFYYSSDYGEHIELRDSVDSMSEGEYGLFMPEAGDSTLHRFFYPLAGDQHLLSRDGGFSWELINSEFTRLETYASGIIPGEIYRESSQPILNLERSENYGEDYEICSTLGFPDTLWIYSAALGIDSGDVYIWSYEGDLYYSDDYAEHFTYLGNLSQSASVNPHSEMVNGAEPGEIYIFHQDWKMIWRAYNYGANVDVIADFPHGSWWISGVASSRVPGELYYLATEIAAPPGGTMEIYHTFDYGEHWTLYEHIIEPNGVKQQVSMLPSKLNFHAWPNPANPVFTVEYSTQCADPVELILFNSIGQKVWQHQAGFQLPGKYQLRVHNESLPSGRYILQLLTKEMRTARSITILK